MDERELVELRVQLPLAELGRLSRLVEQVRLVLSETQGREGGSPAPGVSRSVEGVERGENTAFAATRFRDLAGARAVSAGEVSPLPAAERAGWDVGSGGDAPAVRVEPQTLIAEPEAVGLAVERAIFAQTAQARVDPAPQARSVREEVPPGPEAPGSLTAPAKEVPRPEAVRATAESRMEGLVRPAAEILETAGAVRTAVFNLGEAPEAAKGGRFAMAEELAAAGPAPLTAQAVALAFQRDDRRYDTGFPLY